MTNSQNLKIRVFDSQPSTFGKKRVQIYEFFSNLTRKKMNKNAWLSLSSIAAI